MEVTALCIRLLMNVLMALVVKVQNSYCAQKDGAAFPRILPNRLQFFVYESISFNCEFDGSAGWRVMRTLRKVIPTNISNWVTSAGSGTIKPAFSSDSGEYWCEDGDDGLRSNAVSITVTAGSVILESPVLPVKEGDHVTLHCKNEKSPADLIADFYKDGLRIRTGYKGNMTIYNVSTSDEGLYKCNISGAGESPESRLVVRVLSEPDEEIHPPQSHSPNLFTPLWIVVTFILVALLLFVFGVLHCRKHKAKTEGSATGVSGDDSLADPHHATYAVVTVVKKTRREKVTSGDDVVDPHHVTYAVVKKPRKEKVTRDDDLIDPHNVTYALVKRKEKEPKVSEASTKPRLPEESVVCSSVTCTAGNVSYRPLRAETPD